MLNFDVRLFHDDASIVAIGEGLLAATLPREAWTHEAHLAACCWLLRDRTDIDIECELPAIISAYNVASGGVNDDAHGYHATITQIYIAAVMAHLAEVETELALHQAVNALLLSARGRRDFPLSLYSRELWFSVQARRIFVPPDRGSLERI